MTTVTPSTNQLLHELIAEHKLTRPAIASVLCVNISTVDRWLVPPHKSRKRNPTFRSMPESKMKMLCMVLPQISRRAKES